MIDISDVEGLRNKDRLHHYHPVTNPVQLSKEGPKITTRAKGIYAYADDGRKIIDGASGAWCANIGYGNVRLCEAALHQSKEGLPVGVHCAARVGDEATLIRLAAQLEQACPWRNRTPPVDLNN